MRLKRRFCRAINWFSPDLGMEAIHEFEVRDMPVMVAVDTTGASVYSSGPALWRGRFRLPSGMGNPAD